MTVVRVCLTVAMGCFILAGCSQDPYARYNLGPAQETVKTSVRAIGGLDICRKVDHVEAVALVSSYDASGNVSIDRFNVDMDFDSGTIRANGENPSGAWKAGANLSDCLGVGSGKKNSTSAVLCTIMYGARGTMNLLHGESGLSAPSPDHQNGLDLVRVGIGGDQRLAQAYYFDATTGLLRIITTGADKPGHKGTATLYTGADDYKVLPNGMLFPQHFRVVELGQSVLIGDKPILDVELSEIRVR